MFFIRGIVNFLSTNVITILTLAACSALISFPTSLWVCFFLGFVLPSRYIRFAKDIACRSDASTAYATLSRSNARCAER